MNIDDRIHQITGRNRYCGPAVVSAFTGIPTHKVAKIIREEVGRDYLGEGMTASTLSRTFLYLGFSMDRVMQFEDTRRAPTLDLIIESTEDIRLVVATRSDHFVAVWNLYMADASHRAPVMTNEIAPALLKQRVRAIWYLREDWSTH